MNIDDLTIKQARELSAMFGTGSRKTHAFQVGVCYLIRTVTMMYTGRVIAINDLDIVLEDAAWIADSGRYSEALALGTLGEVEPYPNRVSVSLGAYIDAAEWAHPLPREVK